MTDPRREEIARHEDTLALVVEEFAHFAGSPGNWPVVGTHTAHAIAHVLAALQAEREEVRRLRASIARAAESAVKADETITDLSAALRAEREARERAEATVTRLTKELAELVEMHAVGDCPECGPVRFVDAEGCCQTCGADVVFRGRLAEQGRAPDA